MKLIASASRHCGTSTSSWMTTTMAASKSTRVWRSGGSVMHVLLTIMSSVCHTPNSLAWFNLCLLTVRACGHCSYSPALIMYSSRSRNDIVRQTPRIQKQVSCQNEKCLGIPCHIIMSLEMLNTQTRCASFSFKL